MYKQFIFHIIGRSISSVLTKKDGLIKKSHLKIPKFNSNSALMNCVMENIVHENGKL